jgi:hypothetical protein
VWSPGAARALLLKSACLGQTQAVSAGLLCHLTDGTATAAGTVATFMVGADEAAPAPQSFGAGKQLTKGNALGLKCESGSGTVGGYFEGRYTY